MLAHVHAHADVDADVDVDVDADADADADATQVANKVRPRIIHGRLFRTLIHVLARLSGLPTLVPTLIKFGVADVALETLKEMRDARVTIQSTVIILANGAKNQEWGANVS